NGGAPTRERWAQRLGVAVDGEGNVVIADRYSDRVRVAAERTGSFYGKAMTAGSIYTVAGTGTRGFSGDGGPAAAAKLNVPYGVAVDGAGNLVVADTFSDRIRVVAAGPGTAYGQAMTAGHIYTVAGGAGAGFGGDRGPGVAAKLRKPGAVAVDAGGDLVIADTSNNRIRVVAESTGPFYGKAMTAGNIYTVGGNGFLSYSGDGAAATPAEDLRPTGIFR